MTGEAVTATFVIGSFVSTGYLFGGQAGASLDNGLPEETVMVTLIGVYFLVGVFVVCRTLVPGGTVH